MDKLTEKWQEFKRLNNIEISFEEFKRLEQEEENAKKLQAKRKEEFELEPSAQEELNAKCFVCSSGLSIIEAMIYGNRCIFCADIIYGYKFIDYMFACYYDWKIYYVKMKLINKLGKNDAHYYVTACLANMGYTDINQVKKISDKRKLLKEICHFKIS